MEPLLSIATQTLITFFSSQMVSVGATDLGGSVGDLVGDLVGCSVGDLVGGSVGDLVGCSVGVLVGDLEGDDEG